LAALSGKGLLQNYVPNSIFIIGLCCLPHFIAPCILSVFFSSPSPYSSAHLLSFKDSISLYGFPVTPNTTPEGFLFYPTRPTFPIHETVVLCLCVNLPHDISTQRLPSHNGQISRPQSNTK